MSKIFLETEVPGIAKTYEFAADSVMTVGTVKKAMVEQISAVENMTVFPDPDKVLVCSINMKGLLQDSDTLGSIGVNSGDKIMLI
ncbi:MAG: ubiquitin family protein [Lachnospiraceae bacterium]|nr:ubiquitin family protein [Lachnospiraceae bacterium]